MLLALPNVWPMILRYFDQNNETVRWSKIFELKEISSSKFQWEYMELQQYYQLTFDIQI